MSRKKDREKIYENVEVESIGAEGKSIARVNNMVVFLEGVLPGDIIDFQVIKKKKNYIDGRPIKIHKYSERRVQPFCEHFGVCGGCRWQDLPYEDQLFYKQKQVADAFERIAKVSLPEMSPILQSVHTQYYRNKLEFNYSSTRWLTRDEIGTTEEFKDMNALGFHVPRRFDKIVDIKECYLQVDPSNAIRVDAKQIAQELGFEFYNLRTHEGFIRSLFIRTSTTGEIMLIVVFTSDDIQKRETYLHKLLQKYPEISSLFYVINSKFNDSITDQDCILYKGKDHIIETLGDLKFKIGPKSFFQTNSYQAHELYKKTLEFAQLSGSEIVYDLYTGTGSIALFVAHMALKVIGIEFIPEAIEDAIVNAEINGISNASFYAGDMKSVLTLDFIQKHGKPDVMIVDPPRAGMNEDVVKTILMTEPERIVYVSCNPATQARDVLLLSEKYSIQKIQPVDMFPHTIHVENIALMERKR